MVMTHNPKEEPVKGNEKYTPAKERPYFVHDPQGDGFVFFATEKERDDHAQDCIQAYLDDGWDEEVENVVAGVLTHKATQTDKIERPPDEEIDEDGMDEEGNNWANDFDFICDYKLLPL